MSNFNLPSGAKPIESTSAFSHQSVSNASVPFTSPWAAMPTQGSAQGVAAFNQQQAATNGMGSTVQMGVSAVTNHMPPVASAAQAPVIAQPVAPAKQNHEPQEVHVSEHVYTPAVAIERPVSNVLSLPNTHEGVWELATRMAKSDFCPIAARTPENVFYMLVKAASFGLPWTEAFSLFYVMGGKKSEAKVCMYIKGKEAICRKHGQWSCTVDKVNGVATATGRRYSDGATETVTYDGFDASLRGCLSRAADGSVIGVGNWADKWPDMLKARAIGRLLDALFSDVLGGVTSVEEMNDLLLEAELRKDAAAQAQSDNEEKAAAVISKIRRNKKAAKAIDVSPVSEPNEATAAKDETHESSSMQPALTPLGALVSDDAGLDFSNTNPL